jgi:hypothetical protein
MSGSTFRRVASLRRLEALLRPAVPTGAEVRRGVPREGLTGRIVALSDFLEVVTEVPTLKAERHAYRDVFALEVLCLAWDPGASTFDDVDTAAEELAEAVRAVVADHPQLDQGGAGLPGLVSCTVSRAVGPNPWHTPEGVGSAMLLELTLTTRITGSPEDTA